MHVIEDAFRASDLPRGGIGTIGNYDGIHRGQRAILDRVVGRAREAGLAAVVVTFEPHPLAVLRPESVPPRLTTAEQKEQLLVAAGVDVLATIRFTPEFAATPAETFVRDFLHRGLDLREVYVGADFAFGHRRQGDLELLRRLGEELGFAACEVPEVIHGGRRISSTRIRQAVLEGRVEEALEMLGRAYALVGTIARGERMGKRLGWPTINLEVDNELVPADGVYAGQSYFPSFPASFVCTTNIGTRPTVYENYRRVVEAHVLDFSSDVYGQRVEVGFYKRLREERIFPTVMDLSAQIRRDVEATREFFAARRRFEQSTGTGP
jgi:riboflavin kinase / FMN adenylyltransferase